MLISTVLGRFIIPVYYVLGERIIRAFTRPKPPELQVANPQNGGPEAPWPEADDGHHA